MGTGQAIPISNTLALSQDTSFFWWDPGYEASAANALYSGSAYCPASTGTHSA